MNAAAPAHGDTSASAAVVVVGAASAPADASAVPAGSAPVSAPDDSVAGATAAQHAAHELKRKRTPSDPPPAAQKTPKTTNTHLAINYLARAYEDDLPLISTEDSLPSILHILSEYQGVLERHESMACNLGARPLGPILIKRFERLFDGPPKILKNHGKDGNTVTWLDVVEFARTKPEQFVLGQMSEGMRVCQIHTKQCRVQISEEDFMLISSGMPQKLIPPQPIVEDEEKELGTLEILDKNLTSISHLADQVAARTRQLKHRINGRRQAILERRANEPGPVIRGTSPSVLNGSGVPIPAQSPYSDSNGRPAEYSKTGASAATRSELLSKFFTQAEKERRDAERYGSLNGDPRRFSAAGAGASHSHRASTASVHQQSSSSSGQYRDIHPRESHYNGYGGSGAAATPDRGFNAHVSKFKQQPSPHTYGDNISVHAFSVPQSSATAGVIKEVKNENDGPYRAEMVSRMEALKKGDRVLPPCDRCRRLHMDCIKNLTACAGCTKKHAKCSWRDVRESELWGPEKGKVPIPPTAGMDIEPRDREPSVGLRPTDHASVQLLQALGGGSGGEQHQHNGGASLAFDRDPRALALEGLTAAEHHAANGNHDPNLQPYHHNGNNQHSPPPFPQTSGQPLQQQQQPATTTPQSTGFPPSRPTSNSGPPAAQPYPPHGSSVQHYGPYDASLPSREEVERERTLGS
ncbi:uncharacterized protein PV09_04222 [Verruconis gallopava]|uniref:Zn(2)-C6 fungal-type domain-containing protein n=1 Tax=Verruconis gallopava TaxID=253628 RepID=A0A0D2ADL8_9PEZI|nr:uncharacterized protein PV09_04222 [Verruconis gallopava]KIW05068.1 hypothetical protein PV09_04222 [Verruconis gallopava]